RRECGPAGAHPRATAGLCWKYRRERKSGSSHSSQTTSAQKRGAPYARMRRALITEIRKILMSPASLSSPSPTSPTIPSRLVIASRESALAMWQAEHIRDRLRALYPQTEVSILGMTTQGDQILDVTLSKIGGKGLFVKELETALEDGRADLA